MRIWGAVLVIQLVAYAGCTRNAEKPPASPANRGDDVVASGTPAPVDDKLLAIEHVGPLRLGMSDAAVASAIGAPTHKSPVIEEAATGSFVSNWSWDGIALHMAAETKTGPFEVAAISVSKPPHATARGIKVGSTLAELQATYPRTTEQGDHDPNLFLVGSVYGGLLFKLEQDAVTEIFLGAMAF